MGSHVREYITFEEAIERVKDAREYQTKPWPSTALENAGGRPYEEWVVLMDVYLTKLKKIYAETPERIDDGDELNIPGLERMEKYSAILANLAIWATQAAKGKV